MWLRTYCAVYTFRTQQQVAVVSSSFVVVGSGLVLRYELVHRSGCSCGDGGEGRGGVRRKETLVSSGGRPVCSCVSLHFLTLSVFGCAHDDACEQASLSSPKALWFRSLSILILILIVTKWPNPSSIIHQYPPSTIHQPNQVTPK